MNESIRQFLRDIGRKGGSSKSAKKAAASRKNGIKNKPTIKSRSAKVGTS